VNEYPRWLMFVTSEKFRFLFQIGMGVGALYVSFRHQPILTGRDSPEPFPNQKFARATFFIVGAALILGGLWGLWLARYTGPR
jgi:hypothetical protein